MKVGESIVGIGRPVAYYPSLAKALGGVNVALLLCQLLYWRGKGRYGNKVYKTADDLEEETGLSYREQLAARKKLKALGILRERYVRLQHQTYFDIDMAALDRAFQAGEHRHKVTVAKATSRWWRRSGSDDGDGHQVTVEDTHRIPQRPPAESTPDTPLPERPPQGGTRASSRQKPGFDATDAVESQQERKQRTEEAGSAGASKHISFETFSQQSGREHEKRIAARKRKWADDARELERREREAAIAKAE